MTHHTDCIAQASNPLFVEIGGHCTCPKGWPKGPKFGDKGVAWVYRPTYLPANLPVGFWDRVNKTDTCWLWDGSIRTTSGYGIAYHKGRSKAVHRWVWRSLHGEIPVGMFVCHKCDVPLCVNPEHLFLGTHANNMQDRAKKNRDNQKKKLSDMDVLTVRRLLAEGHSAGSISRLYGVSDTLICNIHSGKDRCRVK